jgi:uridine kinase
MSHLPHTHHLLPGKTSLNERPIELRKDQKYIYTRGRPPWYSVEGKFKQAFVIGVAGGSASGKTSVAHHIIQHLGLPWVVLLSMDSFYKQLTPKEIELAHQNDYNFDHPNAFDFVSLVKTLKDLRMGKRVTVPIYDFTQHRRLSQCESMYGADVVILDGIFALYDSQLVQMMDIKLFVDTDDDIRLARRILRDTKERGRSLMGILKQYHQFVKPAFDDFIRPSMRKADVIIPRGTDNKVAMDLIIKLVTRKLEACNVLTRYQLAQPRTEISDYELTNLIQLKKTPTICALCTLIRNRETNRDDFIFYSQRLTRLLMERCLQELTYVDTCVETAVDGAAIYYGKSMIDRVCGISILRAGSVMLDSLLHVFKDSKIGKILIQTNPETDEPELHYCKVPIDIADYRVILMDATIATGAAALMAIRILLDHWVPEDHIILVTVIATLQGIRSISYVYPQVKIIVADLDPIVNQRFQILPGVGNYSDRFFGTHDNR